MGFAFVSHHVVNKCPNQFGTPVLALDPTGQRVSPSMPVVGSLLVQLGLVMGVFDAEQIVSLPYNSRLCPKPHAQEWCVSCNKCALRGLHACVCRRPCFCVSACTAASLHV